MIISPLQIVNNTASGGGLSWVRLRHEFECPLVRRTERDFSPGAATRMRIRILRCRRLTSHYTACDPHP